MRQGDEAGLRDVTPKCKHATLPEVRDVDTLTLEAYSEASGLGAGSPVEAVRWACEARGLGIAQAREVWHRACLAHTVIGNYQQAMAEVEAKAKQHHG